MRSEVETPEYIIPFGEAQLCSTNADTKIYSER